MNYTNLPAGILSGAKAQIHFARFAARLKSCPDTRQILIRSLFASQLSIEPDWQAFYGQADADIELAEEGVDGAYFVETHFVD
jgi:hypothetical protein